MSQQALHNAKALVAREKLDFGLDGELPRWWYDNSPHKSRLIDALQPLAELIGLIHDLVFKLPNWGKCRIS